MSTLDEYQRAIRMHRLIKAASRALWSRTQKDISDIIRRIGTYDTHLEKKTWDSNGNPVPIPVMKDLSREANILEGLAGVFEKALYNPGGRFDPKQFIGVAKKEWPMLGTVDTLVRNQIDLDSEYAQSCAAMEMFDVAS